MVETSGTVHFCGASPSRGVWAITHTVRRVWLTPLLNDSQISLLWYVKMKWLEIGMNSILEDCI